MDTTETQEKVIKVINDQLSYFQVDPATIDVTQEIRNVYLNMDSLDIVECIMALEEEFDVKIPDDLWEYNPNLTFLHVIEFLSKYDDANTPSLEKEARQLAVTLLGRYNIEPLVSFKNGVFSIVMEGIKYQVLTLTDVEAVFTACKTLKSFQKSY